MAWLRICCFSVVVFLTQSIFSLEFKKQKITVGGKSLQVELAITNKEQSRGLMYRKSIPKDHGMLFIYKKDRKLSFWMKNTFIPLSIGFFNKKKVLVDIQDMEPIKSLMSTNIKSYESKKPASYALEVNQGWFKKNKIGLGAKLMFLTSGLK